MQLMVLTMVLKQPVSSCAAQGQLYQKYRCSLWLVLLLIHLERVGVSRLVCSCEALPCCSDPLQKLDRALSLQM